MRSAPTGRPRLLVRVLRTATGLALLVGLPALYLTQPLLRRPAAQPSSRADAAALERDVRQLCSAFVPRDAAHPAATGPLASRP